MIPLVLGWGLMVVVTMAIYFRSQTRKKQLSIACEILKSYESTLICISHDNYLYDSRSMARGALNKANNTLTEHGLIGTDRFLIAPKSVQ